MLDSSRNSSSTCRSVSANAPSVQMTWSARRTLSAVGNWVAIRRAASLEVNPRYFAKDQVLDNIFWSCASGVTIWSAYEVVYFWASANGWLSPR